MYLSLLMWYLSGRILAGAAPGSLERELDEIWLEPGSQSQEILIGEARYCLARPVCPLPNDDLEQAIAQLATGHPGIEEIIARRISAYPDGVWSHPEISAVVQRHVVYDVLRQIHSSEYAQLVPVEIAERCEHDVQLIGEWIQQCALIECMLLEKR